MVVLGLDVLSLTHVGNVRYAVFLLKDEILIVTS